MARKVDVLVVAPPRQDMFISSVSSACPGYLPVDSVPLRLAAVAEGLGYSVGYLPFYAAFIHWSPDDRPALFDLLRGYDPRCLVISTDYHIGDRSVGTYRAALEIAEMAGGLWPRSLVFYCGKLPSIVRGEVLARSPHIAAAFAGEPEGQLGPILRWLLAGGGDGAGGRRGGAAPPRLDALIFRRDGEIHDPRGFTYVEDLDALPVPAYHLAAPHLDDILRLTRRPQPVVDVSLRTSYGCPYSCRFCANTPHWRRVRFRGVDRVAADLDRLTAALGAAARLAWFDDEAFTLRPERVRTLAAVMEGRRLRAAGALTRADLLTDEVAAALARFVDSVIVGGESGRPELLQALNKGYAPGALESALETAHRHGLRVIVEWIVGLPGETLDMALENLNAMFNLVLTGKIDAVQPYVLSPDPGTAFAAQPGEYGLRLLPTAAHDMHQCCNFPTYETAAMTAHQIFVYYLLAEAAVSQAAGFRDTYAARDVTPPLSSRGNLALFREVMSRFGSIERCQGGPASGHQQEGHRDKAQPRRRLRGRAGG